MKWMIEYDKTANYFRVKNEGVYEKGDAGEIYRDIFSNKFWKPDTSILMDYREADFRNVNYEAMREASCDFSRYQEQIGKSKIAYLASSLRGYGVARQFQMLVEGKISTRIEVFTDEAEAVNWITQESR